MPSGMERNMRVDFCQFLQMYQVFVDGGIMLDVEKVG